MKKKEVLTVLLLFFLAGGIIKAQNNNADLKLSLKEAQEYALKNNKMIKSAKFTVLTSQKDVWTAISSGLPQVSAGATLTDNLKLGVFVLTMNGVTTAITMGMTYNLPVAVQASMPLFSASYYVGIETTKLAQKMAESNFRLQTLKPQSPLTSGLQLKKRVQQLFQLDY